MNALKKKSIPIIFSLTLLCGFLFLISSYVGAQSSPASKSQPIKKNTVIEIPPPIEGGVAPNIDASQALETAQIVILSAHGVRHAYEVELAKSSEEHRIGMMYRKTIDENTGMLFLFAQEAERSFWMKNTFIPLDLIFIRRDGIIHHIHSMAEPKSLKPIPSNGIIIAVLEIAGGEAEILGINIGDRVLHGAFQLGQEK